MRGFHPRVFFRDGQNVNRKPQLHRQNISCTKLALGWVLKLPRGIRWSAAQK